MARAPVYTRPEDEDEYTRNEVIRQLTTPTRPEQATRPELAGGTPGVREPTEEEPTDYRTFERGPDLGDTTAGRFGETDDSNRYFHAPDNSDLGGDLIDVVPPANQRDEGDDTVLPPDEEETPAAVTKPPREGGASINAPRVVERNGKTYLSEHGNMRLLQPNEVEPARQYEADFWKQFPEGFQREGDTNADYTPRTPAAGGTGATTAAGGTAGRTGTAGGGGGKVTSGGDVLPGWDATKWNNGHDSIKYQFGHVASGFEPRTENMPALVEALQAAGIDAELVGDDRIDFHDGFGAIDVLKNATGGGEGWQWIPPGNEGAGGGGGGNAAEGFGSPWSDSSFMDMDQEMPGGDGNAVGIGGLDDSKLMQQLQAEIDALARGEMSPAEREAVMRRLRA